MSTIPTGMVRTRMWRNGVLEDENFPLEQVSNLMQEPDCLIWADLCTPDHAHLLSLAEEFSLDPLAVEDAISHGERPKAMRYATHLFLTTSALHCVERGDELVSTQVSVFVMPRGIVTVRQNDQFDMKDVVRRWDDNGDLIKHGVRALVYGLLDVIVDGYFTLIELLDDEMEAVEDRLFDNQRGSEHFVQRRVYGLRKALVETRRVVLPMREVVNTITHRGEDNTIPPALAPYYADLYDHVIRVSEWTESLRDMIGSIFETNLSLADARLNTIMKQLTSWAAIIAVPTAVTGYFGQNVPYPGFNQHWGFWLSIALMVGIAAALYISFKKRDWL